MRAFLAGIVVLLAAGAAHASGGVRLGADGGLDPVAPESAADGEFLLRSHVRGDGREGARVEVPARSLAATRRAGGALPEYRVVLVAPSGAESDLGCLRLGRQGRGRFRARNPALATLRDFEGGTLAVRRAGAGVLAGTVPRLAFPRAGTSSAARRV